MVKPQIDPNKRQQKTDRQKRLEEIRRQRLEAQQQAAQQPEVKPNTTTPETNATGTQTQTVRLQWSLAVAEEREPMEPEYDNFRLAVQEWVDLSFGESSFASQYEGVAESSIFSSFYNEGAEKPHQITVDLQVDFDGGVEQMDWLDALKDTGLSGFGPILVGKGGLFAGIRSLSWQSIDD